MLESAENSDLENSLSKTEYLSFMEKNLIEKKVEKQNKIISKILFVLLIIGIILFLLNLLKVF